MKRHAAVALIVLVTALATPVKSFASQTNLTQQILPMNCIFQVVNTGTQTLRYITPSECGQYFPTAAPSNPVNPGSVPPDDTSARRPTLTFGGSSTSPDGGVNNSDNFLNLNQLFVNGQGYDMMVRPGSIFTFLLAGDKPGSQPRILIIKSIRQNSITISLDGRVYDLSPGQIHYFDLNNDGRPDIAMNITDVVPDTSASMDCWLVVRYKQPSSKLMPKSQAEIHPLTIVGVLALVYVASLAHARIFRRRKML